MLIVENEEPVALALKAARTLIVNELGESWYLEDNSIIERVTRAEIVLIDEALAILMQPCTASSDERGAHAAACSDAGIPAGAH